MEHLFFLRIVGEVYFLSMLSSKTWKTPLSLFTFTPLFLSSQSIVPKYEEEKNTTCSFQGNTNAIDSHLFDLLEAGQDWDLRRCRQKWSKKVPIVDRERKLKAAKSASEIDFSKFSWPSLRTHASNELHCVCCENVRTLLDEKESFFAWMIPFSTNAKMLNDSLHFGFKRKPSGQRALS